MIDFLGEAPTSAAPREMLLSKRALVRDGETAAAASMQSGAERSDGRPATDDRRSPVRRDAKLRRVAADIVRSVEARLPGRVRDLKVLVAEDHFVLSGMSSSYYVKQVAQHVAMTALDAVMLGRLVNEIEVRSVR